MQALNMKLSEPGNLPYVTLYHNKEKYNFIVDTGSTLSWTTPEVAGKMLMGKEARPVKGFTNAELESAIRVTLRVDQRTFTDADDVAYKYPATLFCGEGTSKINEMNVHVKESIHGILGTDFLLDNAFKIDIDKLQLWL